MSVIEPYYAGIDSDDLPTIERTPLAVVLDNLRSAFNVGSIFRTCDAAAVTHLYLCGLCAHPPNPKLLKTALGAHTYVPWSYHEQAQEPLRQLQEAGYALVAVENTPDAVPYSSYAWQRPTAFVVGHEVEGVSPQALEMVDARVVLPVRGYKRTLNVANSASIVIFEILRQWGLLDRAGDESA